jgi:ubiquinone/menaquinone biosynthesis C-methylase UbiE
MTHDTTDPATRGLQSMEEENVQARITAYWNIRSATYGQITGADGGIAERQAWSDDIRQYLPPPPSAVLDVGAGTGFVTLLLAAAGYHVTAIDTSDGMLAVAREHAAGLAVPPTIRLGDAHSPPFPDESFDVVISRWVLWTLRDPKQAFTAWYRLLRPGGLVIAMDSQWFLDEERKAAEKAKTSWNAAWRSHYSPEVRARLPIMTAPSLEGVVALLGEAGFEDARIERMLRVEAFDKEQIPNEDDRFPRYLIVGRKPGGA